jgi:hypothetical protein
MTKRKFPVPEKLPERYNSRLITMVAPSLKTAIGRVSNRLGLTPSVFIRRACMHELEIESPADAERASRMPVIAPVGLPGRPPKQPTPAIAQHEQHARP